MAGKPKLKAQLIEENEKLKKKLKKIITAKKKHKYARKDSNVSEIELQASFSHIDTASKSASPAILLLIESEKKFRSLFESSAEGICIMSDKFEECNAQLCNLLGYSKEEILSGTICDFSPDFQADGRSSRDSALEKKKLAQIGKPQYFYWQFKRKDNSILDTEVSLKNLIIGNKELIQATVHDITERMRFEKIQNALYKISEAVNTTEDIQTLYAKIHEVIKSLMPADNFYIALHNKEENLITFPYFVDEFSKISVTRKYGKGLTEYILESGEDMIIYDEDDMELRKKGIVELIGEPAAVWLGVVLMHEGRKIGVMAVQDYFNKNAFGEADKQILIFVSEQITLAINRKRISEELINYNKQLEVNKDLLEERARELARLNAQLAESEKRLQDLNASKDKLFSIIAHDLKSPFQPILGISDILLEDYNSLTDNEKIKLLEELNCTIKNQYKLVENLLDWSRLQTGRYDYFPEKINLWDSVKTNLAMLNINANKKNIELINSVSDDLYVYADANMLQSIIQNLISNAIKFTHFGGRVTVSANERNNFVEVSVTDTGIGIAKDDIEKIFRIDVQFTSLGTADEKGTGLGLIICKELVEKNGGKIWIESELDKGSTFVVTFPKA